jgi:hypothetical protein
MARETAVTREQALYLAEGYAWGQEDSTAIMTAAATADGVGWMQFADAYAQMHDDYGKGRRWTAFPVRDAYERWQETRGRTIYRDGESTEEQRRRAEEARNACAWIARPGGRGENGSARAQPA